MSAPSSILSYDDLRGIQSAFEEAITRRGSALRGAPVAAGAPVSPSINTGPANSSLGAFTRAINTGTDLMRDANRVFDQNTEVYKRFTNTGNNFNNDLIAMRLSATQARMETDEFSDFLANNNKNIAGLGSSVTRSSEAFVKLSKGFFDSGLATDLSEMGIGFTELNEILASQISLTRFKSMTDADSVQRSYEAAHKFATELDLTAKLTGQSRKELQAKMLTDQDNVKVQAKIAQMRASGMDPKLVEKQINDFYQMLPQMEAMGAGSMFKEAFYTGGALINERNRQTYAMGGPGVQDAFEIGTRIGQGMSVDIEEAQVRIAAENAKYQKDAYGYILSHEALKGGYGESLMEPMIKQLSQGLGIDQIIEEQKKYGKVINEADAARIQLTSAMASQQHLKEKIDEKTGERTYTDTAGITRSIIDITAKAKEMAAAAAATAMSPGNKGEASSLDVANAAGAAASNAIKTSTANLGENTQKFLTNVIGLITTTGDNTITELKNIGTTLKEIAGNLHFPGRETGSLGTTGNLIENFGTGTMAILHGREGVITEDQLNNIAHGIQTNSIATIAGVFSKAAGNLTPETKDMIGDIQPENNIVNNVNIQSTAPQIPPPDYSNQIATTLYNFKEAFKQPANDDNSKVLSSKFDDLSNKISGIEIKAPTVNVEQPKAESTNNPITEHLKLLHDTFNTVKTNFTPRNESTISDDDLRNLDYATDRYDSNPGWQDLETLRENVVAGFKKGEGAIINEYIKIGKLKAAEFDKAKTHIQESLNDITVNLSNTTKTEKAIRDNANTSSIDSMKNYTEQLNSQITSMPFSVLNDNLNDFRDAAVSTFEDIPDVPVSDIKDNLNTLKDTATSVFKDMSNIPPVDIKTPLADAANQIKNTFNNPEFINSAGNAVNSILPAFTNLAVKVGDNVKDINPDYNQVQNGFGGLLNGILGTITQSSQKFNVMITDEYATTADNLKKEISNVSPIVEPTPAKPSEISTVSAAPSLDLVNFMGKVSEVKSNTDTSKKSDNTTEQSKPKPAPEPVKKEPVTEVKPTVQKDNSEAILMQLTLLNKQMTTLINQHDNYGSKQIKAIKANNGNLIPS